MRPLQLILVVSFFVFSSACAPAFENRAVPGEYPLQGENRVVAATRPSAPERGKPAVPPKEQGPLRLSVQEAVLTTLENNRALQVERLDPAIRRTAEEQALAVFDPIIDAETFYLREKTPQEQTGLPRSVSGTDLRVGVSQFLPTGTLLGLDLSGNHYRSNPSGGRYGTRLGVSVTQSLLQGRGREVNLASLRQARLDTLSSQYEFRGFSEALVAQVEDTYWDYTLAHRQIRIFEDSMKLAERQLEETSEIVSVGRLPETEMVAAEAEIALRRQELIDAQSARDLIRLRLLRLINPTGPDLWERELILLDDPAVPETDLEEIESHVELALLMRPEINQARLQLEREELEVVKTRSGLLPRMDLFISLGKTGYADSFGSSLGDVTGDGYDLLAGVRFQYPFRNRAPKAIHERAVLTLRQVEEALGNLTQLIELDVRTAYIEINRSERQIYASKASRQLEEEKARVENEKFRVGKSTSFLVAQAQRDLVRARILEIRAVVNYLKALVNLYRVEGSLLERWGIEAPGKDPVHPPTLGPPGGSLSGS
jgi:outer membrane protein